MTLTMMLSLMISAIFPFMKHPLSMGLMLIMQTIMIALTTGLMINTFWFSYILIITMLSGALVLFIYMASVASNEKFYSSMNMMYMIMMMIILSIIISLLVDQLETSSMWSTSKNMMMTNEQVQTLLKLFNTHNACITILMVSYLFLTMIAISYIVSVFEGPLRTKK